MLRTQRVAAILEIYLEDCSSLVKTAVLQGHGGHARSQPHPFAKDGTRRYRGERQTGFEARD